MFKFNTCTRINKTIFILMDAKKSCGGRQKLSGRCYMYINVYVIYWAALKWWPSYTILHTSATNRILYSERRLFSGKNDIFFWWFNYVNKYLLLVSKVSWRKFYRNWLKYIGYTDSAWLFTFKEKWVIKSSDEPVRTESEIWIKYYGWPRCVRTLVLTWTHVLTCKVIFRYLCVFIKVNINNSGAQMNIIFYFQSFL